MLEVVGELIRQSPNPTLFPGYNARHTDVCAPGNGWYLFRKYTFSSTEIAIELDRYTNVVKICSVPTKILRRCVV